MTRQPLVRRLLFALSLVTLATSAASAKEPSRRRSAKGRGKPASAAQVAPPKSSGPSQEALARSLARRAMDGALASGDATEAGRLLEQARALCAEDQCPAAMVANLHRDIAVCASALGASDEEITASLREGLRRDPEMTLEAHRRSEKLARLHAQAKRVELGLPAVDTTSEASTAPAASTTSTALPVPIAPATLPEERLRRLWIGVEGSLDIAFLASANDVCRLEGAAPVNPGFFCAHSDGADYPNAVENDALRPGELDSVAGGPTPGNIRVKLRVDLALDEHWLVGGRFGYVAHTYPGSAASGVGVGVPFELEARVTYLHGRRPLIGTETSQYLYLGFGVSETSAGVRVEVVERSGAVRSVDAWQVGGAVYASAGLGVRYALTPSIGILAGPRFALAIGGDRLLPVVAPEIAVHFGF